MGKDHILFGFLCCNINEYQSLVCISREGRDTGDTSVASLQRMGSEEGGHIVCVLGEMSNCSEANSLQQQRWLQRQRLVAAAPAMTGRRRLVAVTPRQ